MYALDIMEIEQTILLYQMMWTQMSLKEKKIYIHNHWNSSDPLIHEIWWNNIRRRDEVYL